MSDINPIVELALLFKGNENVPFMGIQIGTIISPPPNLSISIGKNILLDHQNDIYILKNLVEGNESQQTLKGDINISNIRTSSVNDGGVDASSHEHAINISHSFEATCDLKQVNTLSVGAKVAILPTQDEQTYFILGEVLKV